MITRREVHEIVRARAGNLCEVCRGPGEPRGKAVHLLEFHHRERISGHDYNMPGNLLLVCQRCHDKQHADDPSVIAKTYPHKMRIRLADRHLDILAELALCWDVGEQEALRRALVETAEREKRRVRRALMETARREKVL